MAAAISVSEARKNLFPLVKQVNEDHDTVEIVSKGGNAVLMSKEDYDSLMTTVELLSGRDGARLRRSIQELESGGGAERDLIE
ncbi:type II toxin-antitoxin system prevent-host-death family antitoxin [Nocardia sp. NBC_00508]|uniref:type II toxin-antitoxin system Phd/YefM family antitoxin n=1 Tax=Nocardia sp. NBC_00508 TaxID=2975992 RepID=UPI002E821D37|nr:type II toxin-antitoxin system prevent-host-death family antitoxin [Nocardia sp. NBC_00508]WUD63569.1 type II toxin-antitoxin system prevent-host-death family antitoxin [Nocardia sp. NBC_00508]